MPTAEQKASALKEEIKALRVKRNDPATSKAERERIQRRLDAMIWDSQGSAGRANVGQPLD